MAQASQLRQTVPEMMVGSSTEVSERLHRTAVPRALAFTFADNDQQLVFEGVFRQMTAFLPQLIRQRQSDALEKIVGALLPEIAISDAALAEARMMVDAKSTILRSGDFLPAGEIAKMAGYSSKNPSAQPNKWKRAGNIFAFQHKGIDYFPLYALDPVESYRPYKALAEVLNIFGETKSGWGTAFWFAGLNSFLDDQRPQDLLGTRPDLVIAAAQDEVDGVQHG
jgi:hypothetical protein